MMIKEITSTANPTIKELSLLKPSKDAFLVEGEHLVEMASESGCLDEVYFVGECPTGFSAKEFIKISEPVQKKLSSAESPAKIYGLCHKKNPSKMTYDRFVILDRVQDPGNVGAILRSCLAFGFKDVLFLSGTCSPFNHKAIASSQGALFNLNFAFLNEEELLRLKKENGLTLFATALQGGKPLENYPFDPSAKLGFIFGNEGKGVSENLLSKADEKLFIAMEGIDSLNVAVATGILLHSVYVL